MAKIEWHNLLGRSGDCEKSDGEENEEGLHCGGGGGCVVWGDLPSTATLTTFYTTWVCLYAGSSGNGECTRGIPVSMYCQSPVVIIDALRKVWTLPEG